MASVSIIVPVLNELARLPGLCQQLAAVAQHESLDIIFVDGGSTDDSIAWLLTHQYKVVSAERGRALQMNAGAKAAQGHWLVFLHADTQICQQYIQALYGLPSDTVWGHANVTLDDAGFLARAVEHGIRFRAALTGVATGDQTIFVRRDVFESIGGYDSLPLMEDVALSRRLNKSFDKYVIPVSVVTSSRKWQKNGYIKTIVLMWCIQLAYVCGVSTSRLHRWYYGRDI